MNRIYRINAGLVNCRYLDIQKDVQTSFEDSMGEVATREGSHDGWQGLEIEG